ncbi:MAG: branched-chain amino acid transport system II carrier protein [Oligoflexales bacterium]|nr:branched-chain amino acid transport system II carrier protein [Oligoflexales bacterium]
MKSRNLKKGSLKPAESYQDKLKASLHVLVVGFALFSMFFGSGNLIYPLTVGQNLNQSMFLYGLLGFLLTAVLVPFSGTLTMVLFDGNYNSLLHYFGKKFGILITFIVLLFWIPLGSGPRCITVSHAAFKTASLHTGFPEVPLWLFSLIYSLLIYWLSFKKSRILDIIGGLLTPFLLISLLITIYLGLQGDPSPLPSIATSLQAASHPSFAFSLGLQEGYYTMDLISSLFFSSTVIGILKRQAKKKHPETHPNIRSSAYLWEAARASVIGVGILTLVYIGLIKLAIQHSEVLLTANVPKEAMISYLAIKILGFPMAGFTLSAIILACLTTSIALCAVFSEFLQLYIFKHSSYRTCLLFSTSIVFAVSTQGFSLISSISTPVFQILYPFLILLILIVVPIELYRRRQKSSAQSRRF